MFIDTTRKNYGGLVDHFVSDSISDTLTADQIRDLSIAYSVSRRSFHDNETIKQLNESVRQKDVVKGREVSLDLREDDPEAWKQQMAVVVDAIPFELVGFGTQNIIKIELALRNADEQADLVLMEEPENNLSFSNMAVLINHITQSNGKQVFISTHSSYIANKLSLSNVILVRDGVVSPYSALPDDTKKYFVKLPGYDTLRFILASKVILVEGPTDELIIQKAYFDKHGKLPSEDGIDIIAVDSLAFKRYLDIAVLMEKPVVIVTDNDKNIEKNIKEKYRNYQHQFFTFYYEQDESLNTIEPSVLAANLDETGQPTEIFKKAISSRGSMMNRDREGVLDFMSAPANKSEWAYRVFEAEEKINYPEYITNVIKHFEQHS
ncbi:MAG: AAA family ATPase [Lachnospiraceae bacterium]|nr:AAA family ATPase [Lachnospiraceae bacterium]